MRKDYMAASTTETMDETAFVEQYWTDVWVQQGGPKNEISKIPKSDEFKVISPYIDLLPKGARILDGGCGLGNWTAFFAEQGFDCVGFDISKDTVAKLNDVFPDSAFQVGDIRQTEFADNSFDAYFSWGVFEHFEQGMQPCLNEAFRILKPGGHLFISVPFDNLRHALLASADWKQKQKAAEQAVRFYQWRFTRGELRDQINSCGFDVLKTSPIHKRQGVLRSLHHEFKLDYHWFFSRGMSVVLSPFVPGGLMAHMILAVAQKPHET